MSVGNDVVDLADPEARLSGLHPRWGERVFCAAERKALDASRSRHLLHWTLWAAKESAYKARRRLEPRAVFSPKDYEIELSSLPAPAGVARGRAFYRSEVFDLEVRLHGESVHSVATSEDEAGARVLGKVEETSDDPGVAVRRLAVGALGPALGLGPVGLRIVRRPPVAIDRDRRIEVAVSLSHHGRFVAFACTLVDSIRPSAIRPDPGPAARGR